MKVLPSLFLFILPLAVSTAAPIAYSGKVAVNGVNLDGVAQFKFTLVDQNSSVLWNHADDANASVSVNVEGGHYSILLGESMNPIPTGLFLDHPVVLLQVHLNVGNANFLHLQPDQRIVSAAHALSASIAESAKVADAVKLGSVTREHLSPSVLADLNATISRSRLAADVLADLDHSIASGSISRDMLASDVRTDLNASLASGSVTRDMLTADVRADLNASLSSASVTAANIHPDLVKYFLPEISNHPATSSVLKGTGATLSSSASGKYLTYQWQKDGSNLVGETNATLVLTDVNGSRTGQYRLVVSNDWGSVTSNAATFTVATNVPTITLEGNASETHEATTTYVDPGATAVDALNGNLTAAIAVTGSVDENQTGQNQIKYNVSDAGGNAAVEKVRTVTVVDTTAPVITLVGDANVSHGLNVSWNDPGATGFDSLDGNLSAQISISGTVDVNQTGANVLTYSVSDAAGNSATSVSRTVNVVQPPPSGPWNFTSAGASGRFGPTQTQIDANYSGTTLAGKVTVNTQGIQEWTVPATGTYTIEAWGAQGGSTVGGYTGGEGARMKGDIILTQGDILRILVGHKGVDSTKKSDYGSAGGGGGSFVAKGTQLSSSIPLVVAGGGGGAKKYGSDAQKSGNGGEGLTGQAGGNTNYNGGVSGGGGARNSGGAGGFAGGGFSTDGEQGSSNSGKSGFAFLNGGVGGLRQDNGHDASEDGGFGGGGGGMHQNNQGGGGGGGYSGGGAGHDLSSKAYGGGGGSYNSGTNQDNTAGANEGHGKVTITFVTN